MNETTDRTQARPDAETLLRLAPRLMTLSIDSAASFVREASEVLRPVLPATSLGQAARAAASLMRPAGMCGIPETECPPRCVCSVDWEVVHGETARCTIRVVNTGTQARTFHVSGGALSGPGSTGAVDLSPKSLDLQPGASGTVEATYGAQPSTAPGTYHGEVLIRGAYEQCVRLSVRVRARQEPKHCLCVVEQGDPPTRLRAHRWYDHFQCEEECFPRVHRSPPPQETPGIAARGPQQT